MKLRSKCGVFSYHFQVTPGGWALVCLARDPFFQPSPNFRFADLLATSEKAAGADHFKPEFEIDYLGIGLINIAVFNECSDRDVVANNLRSHLKDIESEFRLGLLPLVDATLCSNFLIGLNGNRSFRDVSRLSESTLLNC